MKRGAVLVAATAVAFITIYQAARFYVAWHFDCSASLAEQIRGAKLEDNAEAWDQLGEAVTFTFESPEPDLGRSFFERSVALNPWSARSWTDLAQLYEAQGSIAKAQYAFELARQDYPISAEVAWKFGNFLLRQDQIAHGVAELHCSLLNDPALASLAISRIWTIDPDVNLLLRDVLPRESGFYFQALDFFSANHEDQAARLTWREIIKSQSMGSFALPKAFPFIDELIASNKTADAATVWKEALAAAHWPIAKPADNSLVWNGGFEFPIADGGLDWRLDQEAGDYISIDSATRHSGQDSLRVDFTGGANLDFSGAHQFVPVTPSTAYTFRCFMRTQSISTESGLLFEILDRNNHELDTRTLALTGTSPWTQISIDFLTGPDTHFLDVRLRRFPSRLFDNKLSGTVWVDDVTLTPNIPGTSGSTR